MLFSLAITLLSVGAISAQYPANMLVSFPIALGRTGNDVLSTDTPAYSDLAAYYKDQCDECKSRQQDKFAHPNACNVFITCVEAAGTTWMYASACGEGSLFDETIGTCVTASANPNLCPRGGNPCNDPTVKIPVDLSSTCGQYLECNSTSGLLTRQDCPNAGSGVTAMTGDCDLLCPGQERSVTFISKVCSPGNDSFHIREVQEQEVRNATGVYPETVVTNKPCPADTQHMVPEKCECDAIIMDCVDSLVVHLFSPFNGPNNMNTWMMAQNNNAYLNSSYITGNATIISDFETSDNNRGARFDGQHVFFAPKIEGNDLGYRFSFEFSFLPLDLPSGNVALADNGNCGKDPSYGCMLRMTGGNRGRVVCYISPPNQQGVELESDELSLNGGWVNVVFARDGTTGLLRVQGNEKQAEIPEELLSVGNGCPLTIGAGTNKGYFRGYMDEMELMKYCQPFLQ